MLDPAQPLQPDLVKSATDDDDNSSASGHDKAVEYLLRYETMVRQQEAEDMATLAHIRPILKRLQKLSGEESSYGEDIMAREITFYQLEKARAALEQDSSEAMTTDRQLMLVLRTLTKKSPETQDECISFAEFYQCYKTVVTGMQTLQYVPSASLVRSRTKDRTLSILSLFESPSTKLFTGDVPLTIHTNDEEALVGDRRYVPLRRTRKRNVMLVVVGLVVAAAALFFSSSITISNVTDEKVKKTVQVAKSTTAIWLLKALEAEMPTLTTQAASPSSTMEASPPIFADVLPRSSIKIDTSLTEEATPSPVILEDVIHKEVAVLAGATGVAVGPVIWGAATFLLSASGLGGLGVLSVFTLALAPVMNGLDVVFGKLLRKLTRKK
jgi:hypothetical protein